MKDMAAAMVEIQKDLAERGGVVKDKTANAGKYGYSYAGLDSIMEAVQPAANTHGVAVLQMPLCSPGNAGARTVLAAETWTLSFDVTFPLGKAGPQDVGSYISYARRYALLAVFGLAPADDDGSGEKGQSRHEKNQSRERDQRERKERQRGAQPVDPSRIIESFGQFGVPERMLVAECQGTPLGKLSREQHTHLLSRFKLLKDGQGVEDVFTSAALEAMDAPDDLFGAEPSDADYDPADLKEV